ncbi:methyl-accepting chemotaxis protein [Novimethylophilus kurashikiensis]|nr:methyl-accepting chemotaxis protein [Novimethylophilus kurashikiensis]
MKFRTRLLVAPLVAVVMMLILGATTFYALSSIRVSVNRLANENMETVAQVDLVLTSLNQTNLAVYRLITWIANFDEARIKKETEQINAGIDKAAEGLARAVEIDGMPDAQKEALKAIAQDLPKYKKSLNQALDMAGSDPASGAGMMQAVDKKFIKIASAVSDIVEQQRKEANGTVASVQSAFSSNIAITSTLVAIAAVVSLLITWRVAQSVTRPVLAMEDAIVRIGSSGDLTIRVPVTTQDELGEMGRHLNETLVRIGGSMRTVIEVAAKVGSSAEQVAMATRQLTQGANEQASAAAEMAATVEEITASIGSVAEHAAETEALAERAAQDVARGGVVVSDAGKEMSLNAAHMSESAAHIAVLSQQSQQVGGIVEAIRDIAEQTNLLALNAAIEAARAGESGRGFAVVADEVRKLAERTTTATAEIGQLIGSIQNDTARAVSSMQTSSVQANKGAELADEAGRVFAQVNESTQTAAMKVRDITDAVREQNAAGKGIALNIEKVTRMTEESSAATASVADAATHLQQLATSLETAVTQFRV